MKNGSNNLGDVFGVRMCLHLQLQFLSLTYHVFSCYETDCICDIIQKCSNKLLTQLNINDKSADCLTNNPLTYTLLKH